ncbi:MAG: hypothetical protein WCP73_08745 [Eubacteriales bacterium]
MLYCEDCMCLTEENECPFCGNKKLREARENDPVYIITKDFIFAESIEDILTQNNIPCIKKDLMGAGLAARTGYATTYQFFVPFGAFAKAKELLYNFFEEEDK